MAYFPFPILPTNNPYYDFLVSISLHFLIRLDIHNIMNDLDSYNRFIVSPTFRDEDMTPDTHLNLIIRYGIGIINLLDIGVKGIRVVIALVNDTHYMISRFQEEWNILQEENRRLEEEKRKSVHSFLKFIQNHIELVKQKKIFLEEMHKEKL
jgi:hypothetical protein